MMTPIQQLKLPIKVIRRAKSHPGGSLALGLHAVRAGFHEVGLPALEPPRRFPLPDTGGLLHLPKIAAPSAGRTAVPDRRCLPIKSIRILPGPSSRLGLLFPPVMAVNLIRVHEVLPQIIYWKIYNIDYQYIILLSHSIE